MKPTAPLRDNDNDQVPNPKLRDHVQSHSFVLTMKPSHMKWLYRVATNNRGPDKPYRGTFERDDFVTGIHGCINRGLVEYRDFHAPKPRNYGKDPLNRHYRLTKAGWSVLDLLAEAGFVPAIDRRSALRRLVA